MLVSVKGLQTKLQPTACRCGVPRSSVPASTYSVRPGVSYEVEAPFRSIIVSITGGITMVLFDHPLQTGRSLAGPSNNRQQTDISLESYIWDVLHDDLFGMINRNTSFTACV